MKIIQHAAFSRASSEVPLQKLVSRKRSTNALPMADLFPKGSSNQERWNETKTTEKSSLKIQGG